MRCIEKHEIILFTKDATCFARMPYDYKILLYNLKASPPTKNMFFFSTTNAKRNTRESALTSQLVQEPKDKKKVRSPLIVEFGNPVDQNVHSCYNRFWPGDISRKAQETLI